MISSTTKNMIVEMGLLVYNYSLFITRLACTLPSLYLGFVTAIPTFFYISGKINVIYTHPSLISINEVHCDNVTKACIFIKRAKVFCHCTITWT